MTPIIEVIYEELSSPEKTLQLSQGERADLKT
jgi:hypothetical protein